MSALVVLAHGTASDAGTATVERLVADAGRRLPGVEVRLGYVDVRAPDPARALAGTVDPVVVPLFLLAGYHVRTDVPDAVAAHGSGTVTEHLGAAPEVITALAGRLAGAGAPQAPVVLASAGSSDPRARAEVEVVARALADRTSREVAVGVLSGDGPAVADVAGGLARPESPVLLAHLLAPGHFHRRLEAVGAGLDLPVTAPVLPSDAVADLVVRRYREALGD